MNFYSQQYLAGLSAFNRDGEVAQSKFAKKIKSTENATTLGIKNDECAIVMSHKLHSVSNDSFPDPDANERVKILRDHMGGVISGRLPDALVMLDNVQRKCIEYRAHCGIEMSIQALGAAFKQSMDLNTINVNNRHLGSDMIVASYEVKDGKPWLYKLQSGDAAEWQNVHTGGTKAKKALKFLRAAPKASFENKESIIKLGIKCLKMVTKIPFASCIELGIVSKECPVFRIMSADEIANYFHHDDGDDECAADEQAEGFADENAAGPADEREAVGTDENAIGGDYDSN